MPWREFAFESGRLGAIALGFEQGLSGLRVDSGLSDAVWVRLCQAVADYIGGYCMAYAKSGVNWSMVACRNGIDDFKSQARLLEEEGDDCVEGIGSSVVEKLGVAWCGCVPVRSGRRLVGALVLAREERVKTRDMDSVAILVRLGLEHIHDEELAERGETHMTLASLAHEIKTPLAACMAFTEMLGSGVFGNIESRQGDIIRRMLVAERHMASMVSGIMDWSKTGSDTMEYEIRSVPVAHIVRELECLVLAGDRILDIVCRDEGQHVLCDVARARQILVNLVGNAVKFTPPGGRIGVLCRDDGDMVSLIVEDEGVGIPASEWEHIFNPFVQRSAGPGIGLGLPISRRLARAMRGDVRVERSSEHGTAFVLQLAKGIPEGEEVSGYLMS